MTAHSSFGVANDPSSTPVEISELRVDVPAERQYVRTVRLLTGDAAARAGFSFDEIEDLRLVVSELCYGILAPNARALSVRFGIAPGCVSATGEVTVEGGGAVLMDATTSFVVDVVCDHCTLGADRDRLFFSFDKRSHR